MGTARNIRGCCHGHLETCQDGIVHIDRRGRTFNRIESRGKRFQGIAYHVEYRAVYQSSVNRVERFGGYRRPKGGIQGGRDIGMDSKRNRITTGLEEIAGWAGAFGAVRLSTRCNERVAR